ncbi:fibrinogen-like protein A [Branchiostoma floridae x Branchiostoma belcheri]
MARCRRISIFFSTILTLSLAQTDPTPNYDVTEHGDSCLYSLLVDKPVGGCQETFSPRKRHTDLQNQLRDMDQAIDMAEERRSQALVEKKNNLLKEEAARLAVENEIAEIQFRTQDLEESNGKLGEKLQEQTAKMKELQDQIKNLNTAISQLIDEKKEAESDKGPSEPASSPTTTAATPGLVPTGTQQPTAGARDCTQLKKDKADEKSGVKTLVLPDGQEYQAFCDFSSPGGPWTVIQRRQKTDADKQVDFFKTWDEYRKGFGNPDGEYWIGNHVLHQLTKHSDYELRVDLRMTDKIHAHAHYDMFRVKGKESNYQLKLGEYTGTAGDAMYVHRDQPFSTKDREHDTLPTGNCASAYRGGWWYAKCFDANLNGDYSDDSEATLSSVSWVPWQGYRAIPYVEMKIRHKPAAPAASVP